MKKTISHNKVLPMLLFVLIISIHTIAKSKVTSKVTNHSKMALHIYWTAAGCAGISHGIKELCYRSAVLNNDSSTYVFGKLKTNIQVKVDPACEEYYPPNVNDIKHDFFCPSGNWVFKSDGTCMLVGKGRGHVRNIIINDFNKKAKHNIDGGCPARVFP